MGQLTQYFNRFIKSNELMMFMEGGGPVWSKDSVEDMLSAAVLTKWNPISEPPNKHQLCIFMLENGDSKIACLHEVENAVLWLPYKN